jgi:hypothetical protein
LIGKALRLLGKLGAVEGWVAAGAGTSNGLHQTEPFKQSNRLRILISSCSGDIDPGLSAGVTCYCPFFHTLLRWG